MFKAILVTLTLVNTSDIITTGVALKHGGREVVVPSQNVLVIDSVVIGENYFIQKSLISLHERHPKLANVLGWSIVVGKSIVVSSNVNQLRKDK